MDFQEAEYRFRELEKMWSQGRMDIQAYRQYLANLRVVDTAGQTWMMQEHTGQWFVLRGTQWVAARRPATASLAAARPQAAQPRPAPAPRPAQQRPAGKPRQNKSILLFIVGFLGTCLVCGFIGGAGYLAYSGKIPLPDSIAGLVGQPPADDADQPPARVKVKAAETTQVSANGVPQGDSHGVTLAVPGGAVEEGGQVSLQASDLEAAWVKTIKTAVTIDTPFYRLEAKGKNDTPGSLSLSFPAAGANSRVLAVVDNEYLVELAQVPQDGKLTVETRAGPADTSEMSEPEGYDGTGTIYYTVITPNTTSQSPAGAQMVSWHPRSAFQADERNCIPDISIIGGASLNLCRQNPSGTVQVMLPNTKRELIPQVDQMVDKIEAVMKKYFDLGFTTAQLSTSSPMLVRVSTKVSSPSYYPLNGVLYIPVDTVTRIASLSPTDVYHEMAHWIQAVKYSTRMAYWSGEKTWWLETAAENMVMLVEPAYVGGNLTTYGTISNGDNSLVFQSEPYQWPGDYYVHAQLLKVNLCDNPACPLSAATFAKAISEGTYPLMDGGKKSMVSANLKDYAYYLLGKTPTAANSAIPLSGPVSSGEGFGEYVRIARTANTDLKYDYNGMEPQMRKEMQDGKETLAIQATIQRDGVYPLTILGGDGNNPGLPVEIVIEPGAEFYYTLDDGPFQYASGASEVRLLPIHGQMGIKKVRIVAVGVNGGEVFKARVQPLELQGTWVVMLHGEKTAGGMTCVGSDEPVDNPDGTAALMAYVMEMTSGMGEMLPDTTGRSFDFQWVSSRVPADFVEGNVTFDATALLMGEGIKYQGSVDVPKADSSASLPPAVPLVSAGLLLPALWLLRKRADLRTVRLFTNLVIIALLVLVSTGCFGMGMYGTATLDAVFNKIEYSGGQDTGVLTVSNEMGGVPTGTPMWKMTGSGTYNVNFSIETTVTDQNGQDNTQVENCTGAVTYPLTVYVYEDFRVVIPEDD